MKGLSAGFAAAALTLAVSAPAAQAAQLEETCPARAFSPVFAAWGDNALYHGCSRR